MSTVEDGVQSFCDSRGIVNAVPWLFAYVKKFFDDAPFRVSVMFDAESESDADWKESGMLAISVLSDFNPSEFRERRHALYNEMQKDGHGSLYRLSSIYQKRIGKKSRN